MQTTTVAPKHRGVLRLELTRKHNIQYPQSCLVLIESVPDSGSEHAITSILCGGDNEKTRPEYAFICFRPSHVKNDIIEWGFIFLLFLFTTENKTTHKVTVNRAYCMRSIPDYPTPPWFLYIHHPESYDPDLFAHVLTRRRKLYEWVYPTVRECPPESELFSLLHLTTEDALKEDNLSHYVLSRCWYAYGDQTSDYNSALGVVVYQNRYNRPATSFIDRDKLHRYLIQCEQRLVHYRLATSFSRRYKDAKVMLESDLQDKQASYTASDWYCLHRSALWQRIRFNFERALKIQKPFTNPDFITDSILHQSIKEFYHQAVTSLMEKDRLLESSATKKSSKKRKYIQVQMEYDDDEVVPQTELDKLKKIIAAAPPCVKHLLSLIGKKGESDIMYALHMFLIPMGVSVKLYRHLLREIYKTEYPTQWKYHLNQRCNDYTYATHKVQETKHIPVTQLQFGCARLIEMGVCSYTSKPDNMKARAACDDDLLERMGYKPDEMTKKDKYALLAKKNSVRFTKLILGPGW